MDNLPATIENSPQIEEKHLDITPRQRQFAHEYVIDHNQTQAAIRAGYSEKAAEKQGRAIRAIDGVAALISQLEASAAADLGITHRYLLGAVMDTLEQCKETKNSMGVLKAAELLGKNTGTFEGDISKTQDIPQWTGIEIDYGDGKLRMIQGTGSTIPQADKSLSKEAPRKT